MLRRSVRVVDDQTPFRLRELIPFIGAIVCGAVGGCVACIQHARTRRETLAAYAVAYMITGAFGGVMALAAAMVFYPGAIGDWSKLLLLSGGAGVITSLALAAGNLSMRVVLKRLGMEVVVDVRRTEGGE